MAEGDASVARLSGGQPVPSWYMDVIRVALPHHVVGPVEIKWSAGIILSEAAVGDVVVWLNIKGEEGLRAVAPAAAIVWVAGKERAAVLATEVWLCRQQRRGRQQCDQRHEQVQDACAACCHAAHTVVARKL
jgi:hypothetical protein